ncbi:hypothetical protein [Streptomyces sp. NPDC006134]|uniref:hypothetical protein n=1 Tax=Streptomyces sp. NPDC006134 TaxID=3154467 RepID=UPI00340A8583
MWPSFVARPGATRPGGGRGGVAQPVHVGPPLVVPPGPALPGRRLLGEAAGAQPEDRRQLAVLGDARLVAAGHRRLRAAHPLFDGARFAQGPVDDLLDGRVWRQLVRGRMADAAVGLDDGLFPDGPFRADERVRQVQRGGLPVENGPAVEGVADVEPGAPGDL